MSFKFKKTNEQNSPVINYSLSNGDMEFIPTAKHTHKTNKQTLTITINKTNYTHFRSIGCLLLSCR
jgi:hypothetical protein